jgi:hypothetical protein
MEESAKRSCAAGCAICHSIRGVPKTHGIQVGKNDFLSWIAFMLSGIGAPDLNLWDFGGQDRF